MVFSFSNQILWTKKWKFEVPSHKKVCINPIYSVYLCIFCTTTKTYALTLASRFYLLSSLNGAAQVNFMIQFPQTQTHWWISTVCLFCTLIVWVWSNFLIKRERIRPTDYFDLAIKFVFIQKILFNILFSHFIRRLNKYSVFCICILYFE